MGKKRSYLDVVDARPLVKSSRLRFGALETRGVPSILFGVATIVLAAGAGAALRKSATMLPESLREARMFWIALRTPRRELPP